MAMTLPAVGWVDGSAPPISAANLGKYDSYFTDIAAAAGTRTLGTLDADTLGGYTYTQVVNNALPGSNTATALTVSGTTLSASSGNYYVNQSTNPFIINLPQASTCVGAKIRISNFSIASTGLIKINPYAGDIIGDQGASNAIYLQNVDASGILVPQTVELVAFSGYWNVNGQYHPSQSVDANGSQYFLGKLHHLPLNNTISRSLTASATAPSTGSFGLLIQATGVYGIPTGARAIRANVTLTAQPAAGGSQVIFIMSFSDNNSYSPSINTANPQVTLQQIPSSAAIISAGSELDIPLSPSGGLYPYSISRLNGSSYLYSISISGYYMGD